MWKSEFLVGILIILALTSVACSAIVDTAPQVSTPPAPTTLIITEASPPLALSASTNLVTTTSSNPPKASVVAVTDTVAAPISPASSGSAVASISQLGTTPNPSLNIIIAATPTPENRKILPAGSRTITITPALTVPSLPVSQTGSSPDKEEKAFIEQLNLYRQANGRNPLTFEPILFNSARWLAQDMAIKNYLAHTDSQGRDITKRIKAFGYAGNWAGENIAGGLENAADNLSIWQSDDIHKNNLLGANYTKAGAGRFYQKGSFNGWYWVLDLG